MTASIAAGGTLAAGIPGEPGIGAGNPLASFEAARRADGPGAARGLAGSLPDLVVEDIRWPGPADGQPLNISATVANTGHGPAGGFRVRLLVDGLSIGEAFVAGLAPQANATVTRPWNAAQGNHTVRAVADAHHDVPEADEANNERAETLSVPAWRPDLVAEDLAWWPLVPISGSAVNVSFTVRNAGNAPAGPSVALLGQDGRPVVAVTLGPLWPGQSRTVWAGWSMAAGVHTVEAVADVFGAVAEAREDNNEIQALVPVVPAVP